MNFWHYLRITILRFFRNRILPILAIIQITLLGTLLSNAHKKAIEPKIRIRLCKFLSDDEQSFEIAMPAGMMIINKSKHQKKIFFQGKQLLITIKSGRFHLQGKKQECICSASSLYLMPKKNRFMINGHLFSGHLHLHIDQQNRNPIFINILPLEEYLYALLPFEIYQFWPHEMQKVQAIASRTYAIYHLLHARKKNQLFDLKSTNFHQTYNGYHNHQHIKRAINETRGMTLHYDNSPALTMFDACCGGIIPAQVESPHFRIAPFLARKKACSYCKDCSLFSWSREVLLKDVCAALGPLYKLSISKKDKAGMVSQVMLHERLNKKTISASDFAHRMPCTIWSHNFRLSTKKKDGSYYYCINGNGFGHQLGLCQHGANELVKRGWKHTKILSFYYPDTTLKKLYS